MLIDADLSALGRYLKPPKVPQCPKNLVGKGVDSVRSPVTRLREYSFTVDHLSFCEAVTEEFGKVHGIPELKPVELSMDLFDSDPSIRNCYDDLRDIILRVNHSIITEATVTIGAAGHVAVAMRLIEALEGRRYDATGVDEAFRNLSLGHGMRLLGEMAELKQWLRESV
ncbi:hypothetical protein HK104_003431 [Borealophlyctis nickersoniae]|nr:hypothetical protein HK104_003431 [Borealophlyctis nickersoniae]